MPPDWRTYGNRHQSRREAVSCDATDVRGDLLEARRSGLGEARRNGIGEDRRSGDDHDADEALHDSSLAEGSDVHASARHSNVHADHHSTVQSMLGQLENFFRQSMA